MKATIEDLIKTHDFLGRKMRATTCPVCGTKYKAIRFTGDPRICPKCSDEKENESHTIQTN